MDDRPAEQVARDEHGDRLADGHDSEPTGFRTYGKSKDSLTIYRRS
ncbi:hypothetical protein AB0C18_05525 [Nonomuraea muscovyensis]